MTDLVSGVSKSKVWNAIFKHPWGASPLWK